MNQNEEIGLILQYAIKNSLPDEAVKKALAQIRPPKGLTYLIAIGKAAWQMTKVATDKLGNQIEHGIVITKYNHSKGNLKNIDIYEAGHPIPDENSFLATQKAIDLVKRMTEQDQLLFLISGGGSALFELPLVSKEEIEFITTQLLSCGAEISEINTIRKRLSAVKGGKFAQMCKTSKIKAIVLSDVIGNQLDMIASGPVATDTSTTRQTKEIAQKYNLKLSQVAQQLIETELPKSLDNVETFVTGSVSYLCKSAADKAKELGYETIILSDCVNGEARELGTFLATVAKTHQKPKKPTAFILGGETIVRLKGTGKGGRNQEIVLSAAADIKGVDNVMLFSVGSDGTDGPTDAAGGYCDGNTALLLEDLGISLRDELDNNNAYFALEAVDGLIKTGATGTNVNDVTVLLIRK